MKHIELLAPAGSPEALDAAISEGADAVYLGLKNFNARMRTSNFAYSQFEGAVDELHKRGKKIFVAVNTVFEQREADRLYQLLKYLNQTGPDAIIVQDLGTVKLARDNFPKLKIHASTQMNIASAKGANAMSKNGVNRVVLARELSLTEIAAVKQGTNVELEVFVHGALCMSYSGICLFSSFLGGKSANRGCCAQACRRLYQTEDKDGYFFSPDDLELIEFVPELVQAGVTSMKIEGRMKSAEYVGTVVRAYRHMIDHWETDRASALKTARGILQNDFARRKTSYFAGCEDMPDFLHPDQAGGTGIYLGTIREVRNVNGERWFELPSRAKVSQGDSLRVHAKDDSGRETVKVTDVDDRQDFMLLKFEGQAKLGDSVYLIQTKSMSKRFKPVLPDSLSRFKRMPGMDRAPEVQPRQFPKDAFNAFPEGLYAQVSRVEDLYTLQADRPEKAILCFNRKTAEVFGRQEKTAPFRKADIIFALDPFFPESDSEWLADQIASFSGLGYVNWMANNLGHIPLLKNKGLNLIAGPYLYGFNAYAVDFIQEQGFVFSVPPHEISKQNLQKIQELVNAKGFFITVFAYPALFRTKADLSRYVEFRTFRDKEGMEFELVTEQEGSVVVPHTAFGITDRIPAFVKNGSTRFILDFSYIPFKKPFYKEVMKAAKEGKVLNGASRFNYKDGFWQPEIASAISGKDAGKR